MIDKYPKVCNLCGGRVDFISNALIYGRPYGSGFAYRCEKCGAYVGTHNKGNKREALGILSNAQMRHLKTECHALFDAQWKGKKRTRTECYIKLAKALNISKENCHFGYFDLETLNRAYALLYGYTKTREKLNAAIKRDTKKFTKISQRLSENMFDAETCKETLRFIKANINL